MCYIELYDVLHASSDMFFPISAYDTLGPLHQVPIPLWVCWVQQNTLLAPIDGDDALEFSKLLKPHFAWVGCKRVVPDYQPCTLWANKIWYQCYGSGEDIFYVPLRRSNDVPSNA